MISRQTGEAKSSGPKRQRRMKPGLGEKNLVTQVEANLTPGRRDLTWQKGDLEQGWCGEKRLSCPAGSAFHVAKLSQVIQAWAVTSSLVSFQGLYIFLVYAIYNSEVQCT